MISSGIKDYDGVSLSSLPDRPGVLSLPWQAKPRWPLHNARHDQRLTPAPRFCSPIAQTLKGRRLPGWHWRL